MLFRSKPSLILVSIFAYRPSARGSNTLRSSNREAPRGSTVCAFLLLQGSARDRSEPILKAGILPSLTSLRSVEGWICSISLISFAVRTSCSITISLCALSLSRETARRGGDEGDSTPSYYRH